MAKSRVANRTNPHCVARDALINQSSFYSPFAHKPDALEMAINNRLRNGIIEMTKIKRDIDVPIAHKAIRAKEL